MVDITKEISAVFRDAKALADTVPEIGTSSVAFRLGVFAGIAAVANRFRAESLRKKISTAQKQFYSVAESEDAIVAALKSKLASLAHSRYMTKNTGPSEFRQAGEAQRNATPALDAQIDLLKSILKGEG